MGNDSNIGERGSNGGRDDADSDVTREENVSGGVGQELKQFRTPEARDTRLPLTETKALDIMVDSGPNPGTFNERDYWSNIVGGGIESVDDGVRERVSKGVRENHNNTKFIAIKRSYSHVNDDVVIINRSEANNPVITQNGESFRPLGSPDDNRTGQRFNELTFIYQENVPESPKRPRPVPGAKTGPTDAGSVLRHEFFHRVWQEQNNQFKREFRDELPDVETIDDELTSYSTESAEETFCELMTIATHNEYNPDDYEDWVDNTANRTAQKLFI